MIVSLIFCRLVLMETDVSVFFYLTRFFEVMIVVSVQLHDRLSFT